MYKTTKINGYTLKDCIEAKKDYGYHERYHFVSAGKGYLSMECGIFKAPYPRRFYSKCFKFKSIKKAWKKNFPDEELI